MVGERSLVPRLSCQLLVAEEGRAALLEHSIEINSYWGRDWGETNLPFSGVVHAAGSRPNDTHWVTKKTCSWSHC